jgi:hypothetical protein
MVINDNKSYKKNEIKYNKPTQYVGVVSASNGHKLQSFPLEQINAGTVQRYDKKKNGHHNSNGSALSGVFSPKRTRKKTGHETSVKCALATLETDRYFISVLQQPVIHPLAIRVIVAFILVTTDISARTFRAKPAFDMIMNIHCAPKLMIEIALNRM